MKKYLLLSFTVVLIILGLYLFTLNKDRNITRQPSPGKETIVPSSIEEEFTASFLIFTNGVKRTFDAAMYRNQSDKAYISNGDPSIVTIKSAQVTWNDFFKTLPFSLTSECLTTGTNQTYCTGNGGELRFYINGEEESRALDQLIKPGDKLLVTYGRETQMQIQEQYKQIPSVK